MGNRDGLSALDGSRWTGESELWLDERGDEAQRSECTLAVVGDEVRYTWSYQGKPQEGTLRVLEDGGAEWRDSWHQPSVMRCRPLESWALVDVRGTYAAPPGPDWGWRTTLSRRDGGELVLQMANITPWGEEARAVRMILTRE